MGLILRGQKGSRLTIEEVDGNFTYLDDKIGYMIVNTYSDLLLIGMYNYVLRILVVSDEKNNSNNSSEYIKYPNGTIMWQASININNI